MMKELRGAQWELVAEMNMNPDSNGEVWGSLYRYPIWVGVPSGATVTDGWSQKHTAPTEDGTYKLYQYVQNGTLMGFRWEREDG